MTAASTLLAVVYGVAAGGAVWLTLLVIKHWRWTPPEDYGFDDEDDD